MSSSIKKTQKRLIKELNILVQAKKDLVLEMKNVTCEKYIAHPVSLVLYATERQKGLNNRINNLKGAISVIEKRLKYYKLLFKNAGGSKKMANKRKLIW